MNTRNRTLGGFGLAVAALAALSVTACDPYIAADTAAPVVLGVAMIDTNYNEVVPPDSTGCQAPYPQVDKAWADKAFPGLCNPDNIPFGIPTVCPVLCYPPRVGPGYAPLFTGNLGGSYQTVVPAVAFTYAIPAVWSLGAGPLQRPVPPLYVTPDNTKFAYGQIRILFNKLMDPKSIQPDPLVCQPPAAAGAIKVFRGPLAAPVDVTATHAVCYNPNSDTTYWGGSLTVTSPTDVLDSNTLYRVVGQVADQQGNTLAVDVSVTTGANVIEVPAPTGLSYTTANATYTVGTAITSNKATLVPTGVPIDAFTVTPDLPAGLAISKTTGTISGKPTAATATAIYTVKAANEAGSVTTDIVITVN